MPLSGSDSEYDELRIELVETGELIFIKAGTTPEPLTFNVPTSLVSAVYEEISLRGRRATVRSAGRLSDTSRDIGAQFFSALLSTGWGRSFHETLASAERHSRGVRIRVVASGPLGLQLPWELMFDPVKNMFFALRKGMSVLRAVGPLVGTMPAPLMGPARVTVLEADVTGELETQLDLDMLRELAARRPDRLDLTIYEKVTAGSVRAALQQPCDAIYFAGTGAESLRLPARFQSLAVFGPRQTDREALDGKDFAAWAAKTGARVVILAACHTDVIARQLAEYGVGASLGFRGLVGVQEMVSLSTALCRSLAAGESFETAMCEARHGLDLKSPGSRQWALATAYLQAPNGNLFPQSETLSAPSLAPIDASISRSGSDREWHALLKRKALYERSLAELETRLQEQSAAVVPELQVELTKLKRRIAECEQRIAEISAASAS